MNTQLKSHMQEGAPLPVIIAAVSLAMQQKRWRLVRGHYLLPDDAGAEGVCAVCPLTAAYYVAHAEDFGPGGLGSLVVGTVRPWAWEEFGRWWVDGFMDGWDGNIMRGSACAEHAALYEGGHTVGRLLWTYADDACMTMDIE